MGVSERDAEHDARVQAVYARWLDAATRASFVASLAAFVLYLSGAMPSYLSMEMLPRYWSLPVGEFLRQTGAPSGWAWLRHLGSADYLNLGCMALLGLVTALCYVRILPLLLGLGERLQALLAALQIIVLLAAASGFLAGG